MFVMIIHICCANVKETYLKYQKEILIVCDHIRREKLNVLSQQEQFVERFRDRERQ